MNRFLSSHKTLIAAFALFLSAAALPTHAQTLVSNKNFSLTFPAGWTASSIGSGDSAISLVMQFATGSIGYLYGIPHTGLLSAQEMSALMANYGAGDSLEVTASGTKTLGGKVFSYTEIKSESDDSDSGRVRVYFLSQGNYLFEGVMSYEPGTVGSGIAEFETALGTLVISPSAAVHRLAVSLRPARSGTGHDALGRAYLRGAGKSRQPVLSLYMRR